MPTRKIADAPKFPRCYDPEHEPPKMRVFEPGTYEHECPRCGNKIVFVVPQKPSLLRVPRNDWSVLLAWQPSLLKDFRPLSGPRR